MPNEAMLADPSSRLGQFDEEVGGAYDARLYDPGAIVGPERSVSDATSADARRHFAEHGWLSVKAALGPAEVAAAQAAIDDLIAGRVAGFTGLMLERSTMGEYDVLPVDERYRCVRKLWDFCRVDPRMDRIAAGPSIRGILKNLFGGQDTRMFQDMALLKPPGRGREKPWHQDHAFFDFPLGTQVVGVWIALDPATVANGCMQLLDGGHKQGPRNHFRRRDWQLCDSEMMGAKSIAFPLEPGDALFFDGLIPHGTPANNTGERRHAIQFHYCAASAIEAEKDSRLAIFGGEGKGSTC
jgi:phytanoyl-CoA hydroxylase